MANPAEDRFIEAAFRLSKVSVQAWGDFVSAYMDYATWQVERAVGAPANEALTSHGKAQAFLEFRTQLQRIEYDFRKLHP